MRFRTTRLQDVKLIEVEPATDDRGFFARTFCTQEFAAAGLATVFVQQSFSQATRTGPVRGMHFQRAPYEEVKVIRCLAGAVHDVLIDIRPSSPTYMQWEANELSSWRLPPALRARRLRAWFSNASAGNRSWLPDDGLLHCRSRCRYRHDDPAFNIAWPLLVTAISAKDQSWPNYQSSRCQHLQNG